jgi:hypothetical protein
MKINMISLLTSSNHLKIRAKRRGPLGDTPVSYSREVRKGVVLTEVLAWFPSVYPGDLRKNMSELNYCRFLSDLCDSLFTKHTLFLCYIVSCIGLVKQILEGSGDGVKHSELLDFWTSSKWSIIGPVIKASSF